MNMARWVAPEFEFELSEIVAVVAKFILVSMSYIIINKRSV